MTGLGEEAGQDPVRFTLVTGNRLRLDGGAMFGNAPRALWERWAAPDSQNLIDIPTSCLLVRTQEACLLFETGAGAFLDPEMRQRYGLQEDRHVLLDSLRDQGLDHGQVTHLILSHLHFDHAGGLLASWEREKDPALLFPNARILVSPAQAERAAVPHPRDRASFIPGLTEKLLQTGRLSFQRGGDRLGLGPLELEFFESQGHSPGMLVSWIRAKGRTLVFTADLIPASPWVNPAITMGYDRFPEALIDEKKELLEKALAEDALLVHPHDLCASRLKKEGKSGRIVVAERLGPLDLTV